MATLVVRPVTKRADDVFFVTASWLMLVIVVVGFAPSYFLKGAVFAHLPSLLVHLHGAVFTSWMILFVVQTSLVAAGNVRLHRKLGVLGCVIAGLMVILGALVPFGAIRRGAATGAALPAFFTPASFLFDNVLGIIYWGIFVAVAVWQRNNRPAHKRIMFIANLMLIEPALSRIGFIQQYPFLIGVIPLGLIVVLFVFDLFTWKRPLWVTVIAGFLFWVFDPITDVIVKTPLAQQITLWAEHHP